MTYKDKEKAREYYKKRRDSYRLYALDTLGDTCVLCGRNEKNDSIVFHEKYGKPHKKFAHCTSMKQLIHIIDKYHFTPLCYRCHKGVHFCMDILDLHWEDIIKYI